MTEEIMGEYEMTPIEGTGTEIATTIAAGDPELQLAILEKKAQLAPRMKAAIETIVVAQTYPSDWNIQGNKACLSSAGAERIGRHFPIQYHGVNWKKESLNDGSGGYRYIYSGYATLNDHTVYATGIYSTRDKFLGFKDGEYRAVQDINENSIQSAARHIFNGNAIKELLGLRGMPVEEYNRIMGKTGQDAAKTSEVKRTTGAQGGTSATDNEKQKELGAICIYIAQSGMIPVQNDDKTWRFEQRQDSDERNEKEVAADICLTISSFRGKDGNIVPGVPLAKLKETRLNATLQTAKKLKEQLNSEMDNAAQ